MKKYLISGGLALAMSAAAVAAPVTDASDGFYGAGLPGGAASTTKAVVSLSGACSGSFEIAGALDAALWKVRGSGANVDVTNSIIGSVSILAFNEFNEINEEYEAINLPLMAGNFGTKYSTSITRTPKGETLKVSAGVILPGDLIYRAIVANQSNINCAGGSFSNVVAKYPALGETYEQFLPFEQGAAQFEQKSGKVTYQLTNTSVLADGKVDRSGAASYKLNTAIAGVFPTAGVCKTKGTLAAPQSISCSAGKPVNVKLAIKQQGQLESSEMVIGILFPEYAPE